jgi:hypothetical protein
MHALAKFPQGVCPRGAGLGRAVSPLLWAVTPEPRHRVACWALGREQARHAVGGPAPG